MISYKRIVRQFKNGSYWNDHIMSNEYCKERIQLTHAYHLLEKDFVKVFDYIELHDSNSNTFSHRNYELILRACTEFENNCKGILKDNGYIKNSWMNITDYYKINAASNLSEYEVRLNVWSPEPKYIRPFDEWGGSEFQKLEWYDSYNKIKHDRTLNFEHANLDTLVKAMAGLFVVLVSQFSSQVFYQHQENFMYINSDDWYYGDDSVFAVKFPVFEINEQYDPTPKDGLIYQLSNYNF